MSGWLAVDGQPVHIYSPDVDPTVDHDREWHVRNPHRGRWRHKRPPCAQKAATHRWRLDRAKTKIYEWHEPERIWQCQRCGAFRLEGVHGHHWYLAAGEVR